MQFSRLNKKSFVDFFEQNRVALSISALFFIVLELFSFLYVRELKKEDMNFFDTKSIQKFNTLVKYSDSYLEELSQILYDTYINRVDIRELMYEASQTKDVEKLASLREKLYKNNLKSYAYMKTKGVRQLHFHLPSSVSFLRFHRPKRFGDSLVGIRPSLEYVNEHKVPMHVFEEGRIFNGFRNVYPLFFHKEFVGTVEISYSFIAKQKEMQRVEKSSLIFLVSKDIVSDKVFNDEKSNYKKSEFDGLLYDRDAFRIEDDFNVKEIHYINEKIAKQVQEKLQQKRKFSILFQDEKIKSGESIYIDFLSMKNLERKDVAYILNYKSSNVINIIVAKNKILFISFSLLSFLISLSIAIILIKAKSRESEIHKIATHDALTKIYNRYGLQEVMLRKIDEFSRYKKDLSIVFFDIDFFKAVNDTYGHEAGDKVLKDLSSLVHENIRTSDIFARWGGEEFLIVLPETSLHKAVILAEKLRYIIETYKFYEPNHITCSFGVTELHSGESEDDVLKRVDEFLYRAKELGRNKVVSCIES